MVKEDESKSSFLGILWTDFDNESGALIIITVIWESVFKNM